MGKDTRIEWVDHTFNPWIGCTRIRNGRQLDEFGRL
jgi:protein gp37